MCQKNVQRKGEKKEWNEKEIKNKNPAILKMFAKNKLKMERKIKIDQFGGESEKEIIKDVIQLKKKIKVEIKRGEINCYLRKNNNPKNNTY